MQEIAVVSAEFRADTPRLIRDRTRGPVFVTHRRPGPGKYLADRDVCPDTDLARLS
ncbi:hypothetical protein [Nocardia testacea]|uniref:Uncharacterized protein n=1 Tax=Nocardia testacea TaxID=248551 RepID=A0ABW7VT65_9NOCA